MTAIKGMTGFRPSPDSLLSFVTPPYDVIKPGTQLEDLLSSNPKSIYHITLGPNPKEALNTLIDEGSLLREDAPCFYVYEQQWNNNRRLGVLAAVQVDDYKNQNVIRHEKTFDDKVAGRIKLANLTGLSLEPIFMLTKSDIQDILEHIVQSVPLLYEVTPDFAGLSDLHQVKTRIYQCPQNSPAGQKLKQAVGATPLYIADGHHRYHAALRNKQSQTLAYIVQNAGIQSYNRVLNGKIRFKEIKETLNLEPVSTFQTPDKNCFCIYSNEGTFILRAKEVPADVVGKLDCRILEKELYPHLGLTHDMYKNSRNLDYYSGNELDTMVKLVDEKQYDLAVALHPVSIQELMDVSHAGLSDSEVVMPEKSTFFSPKILSGIFLLEH